ncbi:DUF397 domain-containing protein [Streptomyces sp. SID5785]|uniref:DUF397 domain-containing protein n=1 Tax=Streptomyces sp. SID5785 TaxID=2690309 RepID=UPI001361C2F8|nr:DUF397 domain-containing protein [Streptomyces sp. SID5785]MZD05421.1 DUF397 domain-containing protein [Streptomyces sp. SID5785]
MSATPRHGPTVPATALLGAADWRRSSRSTGANNCVETARPAAASVAGRLAVRDSKDPAGPALLFGPSAWEEFIGSLR